MNTTWMTAAVALLLCPLAGRCGPNSSPENIAFCTHKQEVIEECVDRLDAYDGATDPYMKSLHWKIALQALGSAITPGTTEGDKSMTRTVNAVDYCGRQDQSAQLMKIAGANLNRFPSELKGPLGTVVVVVREDEYRASFWTYDDSKGEAQSFNLPITDHLVFQVCKAAGSFNGVTAMGAKKRVQRRECTRLELSDSNSTLSLPNEISLTPSRFRELKSQGYQLAIAFAVGDGVKQEIATRNVWHEGATIQSPFEVDTTRYVVNGSIKQVCMLSAKDRTRLADVRVE